MTDSVFRMQHRVTLFPVCCRCCPGIKLTVKQCYFASLEVLTTSRLISSSEIATSIKRICYNYISVPLSKLLMFRSSAAVGDDC